MEIRNFDFNFLKQYRTDLQPIKYSPVMDCPYYQMQVATSKGMANRNNGASIISRHPEDRKLVSMIVFNSSKSAFDSDRISEKIVMDINRRFQHFSLVDFLKPELVKNLFLCHLRGLNKRLHLKNDDVLNASLGITIRCDKETIVLTFGPATCYVINGKTLKEVETIKTPESVNDKLWLMPQATIIPNTYDSLLISSSFINKNVITDCFNDDITDSLDKMISSYTKVNSLVNKPYKNSAISVAMYKNSSK